ncbi:MAG: LysM peptidoglycan-binding domain-containing protein [Blautia sp.]|nr:LysM peptidoglycan-binding domain-containing protein [Blautia sp.]
MKKRILALLLGGVLAVGGILAVPATAQAETKCTDPTAHINASDFTLTPGNGQVTIQWKSSIPNFCAGSFDNYMTFIAAEEAIENANTKTLDGDLSEEDYRIECADGQTNGSCIVGYLTNDTTYTIYAQIYIGKDASGNSVMNTEGAHTLLLVGTVTPDASLSNTPVVPPSNNDTSNKNPASSSTSNSASSGSSSAGSSAVEENSYTRFENSLADQIETAASGSTVVMDKGISALSNSTMKELLAKGDVSLRMEFTYQDKEYVIIIPAGAALDNDIPWYGPLYLAQHFGNSAGTAATTGAAGTYEVKSGDSLSRIAKENNMTLQQLLAKNPQIKDPNKIVVGQKINR